MNAQPRPFALNVADTAITDLRERLARTRFPDQAPGEPWAYGTNVDYLRGLVEYWRTAFDWRAQEARLNAFAQFKAPLHDIDVHFLHVPGKGPNPCPLLLMHGLTDDNVYFQHSVQLSEALFVAGKTFNFLPLLGTHMVSEPLLRLRRQMRIIEFFDAELKPKTK